MTSILADNSEEQRCKEFEDFFGEFGIDIMDDPRCKGMTPQQAAERLQEELEYCEECGNYTWVDDTEVYRCKICGALGKYSERDYEAEREAWLEHEWETRNDR